MRRLGTAEVVGLLTTVTSDYGRVSMHGVREEVLAAQAESTGLSSIAVRIPAGCTNAGYEHAFLTAVAAARDDGVEQIVFGDLFLEDIREYRERILSGSGMVPVFPLWGRDTGDLAREMLDGGLRATVVCVDPERLPAGTAGLDWDSSLLADLPAGVDPCGENGEFHTCATDGPMFAGPLPLRRGETVARDGFVFADLVLKGPARQA
ncbi:MAG: ATP-binding protein [Acidobacteriota bacterium]|nr:ATP-binding protein [Acidobacteriota bacterium]